MNRRVTESEISLEDNRYQLRKCDSGTACWLFSFLGARITEGQNFFTALGTCSREQFAEIQGITFSNISRLDSKDNSVFPMPIFIKGVITDPLLANDAQLSMRLTSEWLTFVLAPFFPESGLSSPQ